MAEDELAEFPPEMNEEVNGLLYLGNLTDTFEFCGHSFTLRTLRAGEDFAAAQAISEFRDTLKEPDAWMAAQVGLALTMVDGDEEFCPMAGPDLARFAKARLNYIAKNWYWPTIHFLYGCYTILLTRQLEAIRVMQDLSPRSQPTFSPSADSSSAQDTLSAEMLAETQGIRS
jgi:hypothetical protein